MLESVPMRAIPSLFPIAPCLLILASLLAGCSDDREPSDAPGEGDDAPIVAALPTDELMARAIDALGGAERLKAVRGVDVTARSSGLGSPRRTRVRTHFPDRCHVAISYPAARHVLCLAGEEAWSTLDGMPITPEEGDRERLREQLVTTELGLLASLEDHEGVEIEALAPAEGLRWLTVRFEAEGFGPFRMGFDAQTHLLSRVRWTNHPDGREIEIRLTDYREVDGIMTPFEASFFLDGRATFSNHVEQIRFDVEPGPELFARPKAPKKAPVVRHETPAIDVASIEVRDDEAEAALSRLRAWMRDAGHQGAGPAVHFLDAEGTAVKVAIPLLEAPEPGDPTTPEDSGQPRLEVLPPTRLLSVVVSDDTEEALRAARERLDDRAREDAAEEPSTAAPTRHVTWRAGELIQVQRPEHP